MLIATPPLAAPTPAPAPEPELDPGFEPEFTVMVGLELLMPPPKFDGAAIVTGDVVAAGKPEDVSPSPLPPKFVLLLKPPT